jgi:hypothetical protein
VKTASNLEACCAACKAVGACGAFTFLPDSGNCYLKASTGWTRQNKPGSGMQSGILSNRATVAPTPSPKAPTPSPKAPTPSPKAPVPSPKPQSTGYKFVPMTEDQMRRMYQLTSVFENADVSMGRNARGNDFAPAVIELLLDISETLVNAPELPALPSCCRSTCSMGMQAGSRTGEVRGLEEPGSGIAASDFNASQPHSCLAWHDPLPMLLQVSPSDSVALLPAPATA